MRPYARRLCQLGAISSALLMGAQLMGCAAAQPAADLGRCQDAAEQSYYRVSAEPLPYGRLEVAETGFARIRVETTPCGPELLGVQVHLHNSGTKTLESYRADVTVRRADGQVLKPTHRPYNSPCERNSAIRKLEQGDATTLWSYYKLPPAQLQAPALQIRVKLEEPDGLAKHESVFHLDRDKMNRPSLDRPRPRPPAIKPHLALLENEYYRLTVLDKRSCDAGDGKLSVGYEVLLENFTNVELRLSGEQLQDDNGYRYERMEYTRSCLHPDWGPAYAHDGVAPGEKRRGWLRTITVNAAAKTLSLNAMVMGPGLGGDDFVMALGAPAKPDPPKDKGVLASTPKSSTQRQPVASSPKPPSKPGATQQSVFKELEPIPKDASKYHEIKYKHLAKEHHTVDGNFLMTLVPTTPQLWAAGFYDEWEEKRYDLAKRVSLTQDFISQSKDKLFAQLVLVYRGDILTSGKSSLKLPKDLHEYIFLEVDGFKPVRCEHAEIPLLAGLVGPFSKQSQVVLTFQLPQGMSRKLREGTGTARFVIGGLGFDKKNNTIRYDLPFTALSKDAPPALQRIYSQLKP